MKKVLLLGFSMLISLTSFADECVISKVSDFGFIANTGEAPLPIVQDELGRKGYAFDSGAEYGSEIEISLFNSYAAKQHQGPPTFLDDLRVMAHHVRNSIFERRGSALIVLTMISADQTRKEYRKSMDEVTQREIIRAVLEELPDCK